MIESINKNEAKLRKLALSLTKNKADADDLFQDTVLKILQLESKYTEEGTFTTWSYMVMKNIFIDSLRKTKRFKENLNLSSHPIEDHVYELLNDSTNSSEENLLREYIKGKIEALPDMYKEIVELRLQGFLYKEIEEKLRVPINTLRVRHLRVMLILREEMRKDLLL